MEVSSDLRVIAITGPNTGGKTVTLKSIGLASLMAKAGLLLPCTGEVSIPWFKSILVDIGDEQSLQQSLSTFSGHLMRIKNILYEINLSQGPDLVLLDEIGAGTDPTEGAALAIALLKTFAEQARLTIATTHLGELKSLKYTDSRFENASVSFDCETITPTYKLLWGIPGRSNAISIAKKLGLDSLVIKRAEELLLPEKDGAIDSMIIGLEEQRSRQQKSAEEAAVLLARTELLHEELLTYWHKQTKISEEFKKRQLERLGESIEIAQKEVRSLIQRLRDTNADGETARLVGQRLRVIEREFCAKTSQNRSQKGWIPKIGERARLVPLAKAGEILDISQDGLQLTILCGSFRSTVSLNHIESIKGEKPIIPEPVVVVNTNSNLTRTVNVKTNKNTLDVRGMRVHEAEIAVEDYLRKNSGPVWIVHGIGTGKLKRGLRNWLKSLPYVTRVEDAEKDDGGVGCSVIWLN